MRTWSTVTAALLVLLTMVSADAQVRVAEDVEVPSRLKAMLAYDVASDMYSKGRFRDAGTMFLKADLLEPSAAALWEAFKCYQKAGDQKMAATLSKQFQMRYSDRQLLNMRPGEGIVCAPKWHVQIVRDRLALALSAVDDMLKGDPLPRLPENPYKGKRP